MARRVPLSVDNLENMPPPVDNDDDDDDGPDVSLPVKKKTKKRQLKKTVRSSRKRCGGLLNMSLSAARSHHIKDTSLNSSTLKQTLRANNRALARALEQKRRELHAAEQQLVKMHRHDGVRTSLQHQVTGMKCVLNQVCEQLLSTVQLIHNALDFSEPTPASVQPAAATVPSTDDALPPVATPSADDAEPTTSTAVTDDNSSAIVSSPRLVDDPVDDIVGVPTVVPVNDAVVEPVNNLVTEPVVDSVVEPADDPIATGSGDGVAPTCSPATATATCGRADLSVIMEQSVLTQDVPILFCDDDNSHSVSPVTSRHKSSRSRSGRRIRTIAEETSESPTPPASAAAATTTAAAVVVTDAVLLQPAVEACSAFGMRPTGTIIDPDERPITGTGAARSVISPSAMVDDVGGVDDVSSSGTAAGQPPSVHCPPARNFLKRNGGTLSYAARNRKAAALARPPPKPVAANPVTTESDAVLMPPPPPPPVAPQQQQQPMVQSSGILSEECDILVNCDMEHSIYDVQDMEFTEVINKSDIRQLQDLLQANAVKDASPSRETGDTPLSPGRKKDTSTGEPVQIADINTGESCEKELASDEFESTKEKTTEKNVEVLTDVPAEDEPETEITSSKHESLVEVDKATRLDKSAKDHLRRGTILLKPAASVAYESKSRRGTVVLRKPQVLDNAMPLVDEDTLVDSAEETSSTKEDERNLKMPEKSSKKTEDNDAKLESNKVCRSSDVDEDSVMPKRHSRRTVSRPTYVEVGEHVDEVVSRKKTKTPDDSEKSDVTKKKLKAPSVVSSSSAEKISSKKKSKKPAEDATEVVHKEDNGSGNTAACEQVDENESRKQTHTADDGKSDKEDVGVSKKKSRKNATTSNEGDTARKKKAAHKSESRDGNALAEKKSSTRDDTTTKKSSHAPSVIEDDILSSDVSDRKQKSSVDSAKPSDGQLSSDDDDTTKKKRFTAFQTKPGNMAFSVGDLSRPVSKRGTSFLPRVSAARARSKSRLPVAPPAPPVDPVGPKLPKSVYDLSMNESTILVRTNFTDFRDRCVEKTAAKAADMESTTSSSQAAEEAGSHGIMLTLGNGKRTKPRAARGKKVSYAPVPESFSDTATSTEDSPCLVRAPRKRHLVVCSSDDDDSVSNDGGKTTTSVAAQRSTVDGSGTACTEVTDCNTQQAVGDEHVRARETEEQLSSSSAGNANQKTKSPRRPAADRKKKVTPAVGKNEAADVKQQTAEENSQDRKSNSSDRLSAADAVSTKRSRRGVACVSYKEPSLMQKMRQGDPFTENIYTGKKSAQKSQSDLLVARREALVDIPTNVVAMQ